MTDLPTMIFHAPYPVVPGATSASGIRPLKMRAAFEDAGFEVLDATGYSTERKAKLRRIAQRIESGEIRPSFVYSELSTVPAFLADSDHLPRHPWMDSSFFAFCTARGIRVGAFYRDVYWQFPAYLEAVRQPLASVMRAMYRRELRQYRRARVGLFLPTEQMSDYIPGIPAAMCRELPPGCDVVDSGHSPSASLRVLYIGGTGNYYRMQEAVAGIAAAPGATLTICTREEEWASAAPAYADVMDESTVVVHASGPGLEPLYDHADICSLVMEPIEYRDFAAPLKLFEYIGHGKPVIATQGTWAADFVERKGIGWSVPYSSEAVSALLASLSEDPALVEQARRKCLEVRSRYTWVERARQVSRDLVGC